MMLLLFLDDIKSERELMRIIPERLDYLWFLGYGLDDKLEKQGVASIQYTERTAVLVVKRFVPTAVYVDYSDSLTRLRSVLP
jgi:hypothetical protein